MTVPGWHDPSPGGKARHSVCWDPCRLQGHGSPNGRRKVAKRVECGGIWATEFAQLWPGLIIISSRFRANFAEV